MMAAFYAAHKRKLSFCCSSFKGGINYDRKDITCKIVRPIAVLSENERDYTKEVFGEEQQ